MVSSALSRNIHCRSFARPAIPSPALSYSKLPSLSVKALKMLKTLHSFENNSFHLTGKSEDSENGVRPEAGGLSKASRLAA